MKYYLITETRGYAIKANSEQEAMEKLNNHKDYNIIGNSVETMIDIVDKDIFYEYEVEIKGENECK